MNNPYSLLLKEYIFKSGISLTEIENEMRKRGFNKNRAYLSNLQNGKMPPPPFNVTHALCDIIGGDPLRLSLTGVLMEISEQDFFFTNTDKINVSLMDAFRETILTMIATLIDINKYQLSPLFSDLLNDKGMDCSEEEMLQILTYNYTKQVLNQVFEKMLIEELFKKGTNANSQDEAMELRMKVAEDFIYKFEENSKQEKISDEEMDYLMQCLMVYRKLNLKPVK